MKSVVMITGTSGFIGTNLINYLKKIGETEIFTSSRKSGISVNNNFFSYSDLTDKKLDLNNINAVVHLAGKAHDLKSVSNSKDYYEANTKLTCQIFDSFLKSKAEVFIFLSSVKAVVDHSDTPLTEDIEPRPVTEYGKSKLAAETYLISVILPRNKRAYILRACMVHGPGNKGNLNLLYKIVSKGIPWPLGSYENKRSFCSIDNLCFVIQELIENTQIPSGIYNIADDEPLSTKEIIKLISKSLEKKPQIWNIPKFLIQSFAQVGNFLKLPLNSERLSKLTESYIVSNDKIKNAINKPLPLSSRDGLMKTLESFKIHA